MHWTTIPAFVSTLAQNSAGSIGGGIFLIIWLAFIVLTIAGMWKVYTKADQPGWACIVPIYNMYVLTKIIGRPWWWLLLMLVPIVSIVVAIVMMVDLAKCFGKGIAFAIGLILLSPIFMIILGFGKAEYQGPAAG